MSSDLARAEERISRTDGPRAELRTEDFRDLRDIGGATVAYNLGYVLLSWALIAAAFVGFWSIRTWWAYALAFLVISSRQQAFLNVEHDAIHRMLMPSRSANDLLGYLVAAPSGSGFNSARENHLAHHRLLNDPDDPDHDLHQGPNFESRRSLLFYVVTSMVGGYAARLVLERRESIPRNEERKDLLSLVLVHGMLFATLTLLTAWWVYPLLWVVPILTLTSGCHVIRSYLDHGLEEAELEEYAHRMVSVKGNPAELALVAPFNMNYHAEHHMFPWVPARLLPEVAKRLDRMEAGTQRLVRPSYFGEFLRLYRSLP